MDESMSDNEQQLRDRNAQLERLVDVITHDLRSHLDVAQGRIELLKEESDGTHLTQTAQTLTRMGELIESARELAKHDRTELYLTEIELAHIVDTSWQMMATHEATLEFGQTVTLRGDRSHLKSLFENLFDNAVTHAGADVTVRVGQLGEDGIYVEDDGPGIPAKSRDTVFEVGHTSTADGTGLGLAIVAEIASVHGWALEITEATGGGARFEFSDIDIV